MFVYYRESKIKAEKFEVEIDDNGTKVSPVEITFSDGQGEAKNFLNNLHNMNLLVKFTNYKNKGLNFLSEYY